MSRARRPTASIVANPVLIGSVTVLVVVVAVFLAYNANNGLPFVPTRELNVQVASGAELVPGNEVRSGGYRVGVVNDMRPVRLGNGKVAALLTLKLDKSPGGVPADSRVVVRERSALGLKYVELDLGRSRRQIPDGGTLPEAQATVPVELDQVFNMFDARTRRAAQVNLGGFGDALAGRGADLNQTIQAAPELFQRLGSVMANLSSPRTDLRGFFGQMRATVGQIAPLSRTNAHLFTTMANTFDALSRDPQALKDTISNSPPTLAAGTESLRVQRPFLQHTALLSRDLNGTANELRSALPPLNSALATGTPVQRQSTQLSGRLQSTLASLDRLVKAPTTPGALRGLTATVTTLQPQLRFLGPYVTVCNSWNWFWTLVAEHLSSPDATGSSQRVMLNTGDPEAPGGDGIESAGANEFDHGEGKVTPGAVKEYLHGNYYGDAVTPDGRANCAAGQQGYVYGWNPYRAPGVKGDPYKQVVTDHAPLGGHLLGPTYAKLDKNGRGVGLGPARVPAGETFTARPGGIGVDVP